MADDRILKRFVTVAIMSRSIEKYAWDYGKKTIQSVNNPAAPLERSIQGSAENGCMLARNAITLNSGTVNCECDFNYVVAVLLDKDARLLTQTTPGYYLLRNTKNIRHSFFRGNEHHLPGSQYQYINSKHVFDSYSSGFQDCKIEINDIPRILKDVNFFNFQHHGSVHGAQVADTQSCNMSVKHIKNGTTQIENKGAIMTDFVIVLKLMFWPEEALGWMSKGKWPSHEARKKLKEKHECCLVPKQSSPDANDWRLTFPGIESEIMHMLFENKDCYFLLKSLYYAYLHEIKCQCSAKKEHPLGSYLMKTTLLNMSDEYPPDSPLWNDPLAAVREMLADFIAGVRHGYMPHFIITDLNILDSVVKDHGADCKLLARTTMTAQFIKCDLDRHLEPLFTVFNYDPDDIIFTTELEKDIICRIFDDKNCKEKQIKELMMEVTSVFPIFSELFKIAPSECGIEWKVFEECYFNSVKSLCLDLKQEIDKVTIKNADIDQKIIFTNDYHEIDLD